MHTFMMILHLLLIFIMIFVIILQHNDGSGLGFESSNTGVNFGIISPVKAANFLTRTTVIVAGLFLLSSVILSLYSNLHYKNDSILNPGLQKKIETQAPIR